MFIGKPIGHLSEITSCSPTPEQGVAVLLKGDTMQTFSLETKNIF